MDPHEPRTLAVLRSLALLFAMASVTALLAACDRKDGQPRAGAPKGMQSSEKGNPQAQAGRDSMFFPSGQKEGSSIRVDKDLPAEIWVGRPFTESITVTNISPAEVQDIVLNEQISPHFSPAGQGDAEIREGQATWRIGSLKAGESRTIKLEGSVREAGEIRHCLRVDFQPQLCTVRTAAVAALSLSMTGPKEALICEGIEYQITVQNTGTAKLDAVKVEGQLPEGLAVENATQPGLSLDAGTINPGESKDLKVRLKPARRGEYTVNAAANAAGLRSDASWQTLVREPALEMTAQAEPTTYAGSPARMEFAVSNRGDGPSPDTQIEVSLPGGMRVVQGPEGVNASDNPMIWKLGTLPPGETRSMILTTTASEAGAREITGRASGPCVQPVQAVAKTEFRGIPAVLLEVTDDPDPVDIGGNVTYTIAVLNQGDAELTGVRVACALEESMSFASAEGPSNAVPPAGARQAAFEPLARLEPKGKATWKVVVKATQAADARFKVTLTSDQVQRPVEETESTHFVDRTNK